MKTVPYPPSPADLVGAICTVMRVDGQVEIYYPGDALPAFASLTPEQLAALETQARKDEQDAAAAKAYTKLKNLMQMTPAEVQAWVAANVTNLAQAQDAIATLAIAVGVLARRL